MDVGCGFGGTISTLNDHLQNVELIGLNIDSKQLEYAQDMVIARETNQIDFVAGDACKLPLPDNNFDTVLAVECIFHFHSRKEFFSEVRRVLKPSGTLVLSDYVPMWFLKPVALLINSPLCEGNNPYGHSNMNITFGSYRRLAKANQMSMSSKDATANVRPTYDFIDKHYIDHYFEEMKNQFRKANSFAKWDLVRYYFMAFQLGVKS